MSGQYYSTLLRVAFILTAVSAVPVLITKEYDVAPSLTHRGAVVALFNPGNDASIAFLWSSIGLAVITAFLQGLVTSLAFMTETSNYWTFRFRLAKVEHWWWTAVSCLLFLSLLFNVLSFASGNSSEAVSILVLSTTTLLAIVRYMLPSWRSRKYIHNRFLAWTGASRTGIGANLKSFCGDRGDWETMAQEAKTRGAEGVPSDYYGWRLSSLKGTQMNPTDILLSGIVNAQTIRAMSAPGKYVYADGYTDYSSVSLLWGSHSGFSPRVSRSISAVPINLLRSQPFTIDGFGAEGVCLAMGILGRNKGLKPATLVFNMDGSLSTQLENDSAWYPRPAKTLRSYYRKLATEVYGGLGDAFVSTAIELSLILMDATPTAVTAWLAAGCEQQSIGVNRDLQDEGATAEHLRAHYESSYVSMVISLNNMKDNKVSQSNHGQSEVIRPDITCLGLLLRARGLPKPDWWDLEKFRSYRTVEDLHLDHKWKEAAAKLLGLEDYAAGFVERGWDSVSESDTKLEG
jgi:hypothetical protein